MAMERMEALLKQELAQLERSGMRKSREAIITGVVPPREGRGVRYLLQGEGDRPFLRMNSNGYLGLALHPEVVKAEEEGARAYGAGPGAVRFISGTYEPHVRLEQRLAEFHGCEAGMLFSSAYATVMGVLPTLISSETAVLSDELNHNCIINAIRLARPKEKFVYEHLNVDQAETFLRQAAESCRRGIIVTDGIFSMRGDHAPLKELVALASTYDEKFAEGDGRRRRFPRRRRFRENRPGSRRVYRVRIRGCLDRHFGEGFRRQRRVCRRQFAFDRLFARKSAALYLFEPDHARRSGGRRESRRDRVRTRGAATPRVLAGFNRQVPARSERWVSKRLGAPGRSLDAQGYRKDPKHGPLSSAAVFWQPVSLPGRAAATKKSGFDLRGPYRRTSTRC